MVEINKDVLITSIPEGTKIVIIQIKDINKKKVDDFRRIFDTLIEANIKWILMDKSNSVTIIE